MGKEWERTQRDKLVAKQRKKIAEMEKKLPTQYQLKKVIKAFLKKTTYDYNNCSCS